MPKQTIPTINKIINTAKELFFSIGYENTSVNQIIEKVGIAKGTFYHHFKSKIELLNHIIEEESKIIFLQYLSVTEDTSLNAPDKLSKIFEHSANWEQNNVELVIVFMKALYIDENILIRNKMSKMFTELSFPYFLSIISDKSLVLFISFSALYLIISLPIIGAQGSSPNFLKIRIKSFNFKLFNK